MADEPDSLVLRRMDAKLDRVIDDLQAVKVRKTNVEEDVAVLNRRMDRFEGRLDRIERRFDLVEPAH